jgi:hypothetical protein
MGISVNSKLWSELTQVNQTKPLIFNEGCEMKRVIRISKTLFIKVSLCM